MLLQIYNNSFCMIIALKCIGDRVLLYNKGKGPIRTMRKEKNKIKNIANFKMVSENAITYCVCI